MIIKEKFKVKLSHRKDKSKEFILSLDAEEKLDDAIRKIEPHFTNENSTIEYFYKNNKIEAKIFNVAIKEFSPLSTNIEIEYQYENVFPKSFIKPTSLLNKNSKNLKPLETPSQDENEKTSVGNSVQNKSPLSFNEKKNNIPLQNLKNDSYYYYESSNALGTKLRDSREKPGRVSPETKFSSAKFDRSNYNTNLLNSARNTTLKKKHRRSSSNSDSDSKDYFRPIKANRKYSNDYDYPQASKKFRTNFDEFRMDIVKDKLDSRSNSEVEDINCVNINKDFLKFTIKKEIDREIEEGEIVSDVDDVIMNTKEEDINLISADNKTNFNHQTQTKKISLTHLLKSNINDDENSGISEYVSDTSFEKNLKGGRQNKKRNTEYIFNRSKNADNNSLRVRENQDSIKTFNKLRSILSASSNFSNEETPTHNPVRTSSTHKALIDQKEYQEEAIERKKSKSFSSESANYTNSDSKNRKISNEKENVNHIEKVNEILYKDRIEIIENEYNFEKESKENNKYNIIENKPTLLINSGNIENQFNPENDISKEFGIISLPDDSCNTFDQPDILQNEQENKTLFSEKNEGKEQDFLDYENCHNNKTVELVNNQNNPVQISDAEMNLIEERENKSIVEENKPDPHLIDNSISIANEHHNSEISNKDEVVDKNNRNLSEEQKSNDYDINSLEFYNPYFQETNDTGMNSYLQLIEKMMKSIQINEQAKSIMRKNYELKIPVLKNKKEECSTNYSMEYSYLSNLPFSSLESRMKSPVFKLNVVLDIDSTLIYAEPFEKLHINDREAIRSPETHHISPVLGKYMFRLCFRIRKNVVEFLKSISNFSNIYFNTHGHEAYAVEIIKILSTLTGIEFKKENIYGNKVYPPSCHLPKTLRVFSPDEEFSQYSLIIDDNVRAWESEFIDNMILSLKFQAFLSNKKFEEKQLKQIETAGKYSYTYLFSYNRPQECNDYNLNFVDENNAPFSMEYEHSKKSQIDHITELIGNIYKLCVIQKGNIFFPYLILFSKCGDSTQKNQGKRPTRYLHQYGIFVCK